ncbi:DUF2330 domain-containing protein [Actinocatenispora rupis]|uniref:DUF2330 domain-containing protein n=1 Tax=Actinocatenispora rupis TaxID=519421 RepID=A0A8J3N9Y2_9ACTN|nr:DUF2330 domain-containing protein [Actinocatenispora rupis]GID09155.1 hypothetical protein Aru02nite_00440 [Actinocatenispora rupis]
MRRTHRLAAVLAAVLLAQLGLVATPALACACGAIVTPNPDARVADETSLVRYEGGSETIAMSLTLTATPTSAAWFLPVPAKPTFRLADTALFNRLAQVTAPRVVEEPRHGDCSGACAVPGAARPSPDVRVLSHVPVGPYDVATLAASDGTALSRWLTAHGFHLSPTLARGVRPYAAAHWVYVAVRLRPAAGHRDLGTQLPPLAVTFPSRELVYPMRLTHLARKPQTVRLYVLADHRMRAIGGLPSESDVRYADWIDAPTPSTAPTATPSGGTDGDPLAPFVPHRMFLTRFDLVDLAPSAVTEDFRFVRAAADTPHQSVVYYRAGGSTGSGSDLPDTDTLLLVAAFTPLVLLLIGGALTAAVLIGRRRRRST